MRSLIVVIVVLVAISIESSNCDEQLPSESSQIDVDTEFVIFGTRHGNRNPDQFLKGIDRNWGQEGSLELTSIGKRQAYGFGVEFRKFIKNLTSNNYNATEVKYYSSSANRCQMTLQVALAGIHPPESWGEWNVQKFDHWAPVPYTIDDQLLRMYSVKTCSENQNVWSPIDNDSLPDLEKMRIDDSEVLTYASEKTGWNLTENLGYAGDLADNIIQMDFFNTTYPSWLSNPTLPGFNGESLKKKIMDFAEIHPRSCAYHQPCRSLMAGFWLNDIIEKLESARDQPSSPLKIVGYSSHTEITLSVMKLMGVKRDDVTTSAGFLIEFRRQPTAAIRILNHDPNPIDQHVIYLAELVEDLKLSQASDGFIQLDDFFNYAKPNSFNNWQTECGVTTTCGQQ